MAKQGNTDEITKKTTDEEKKDFKAPGIEGKKDAGKPKDYITGEDVIKRLRERGVKI